MSDRIKALREKRAKLVTDARAELDKITDKTPEAEAKEINTRFDSMMAEADRLKADIDREERLTAAETDVEESDEKRRRVSGREPSNDRGSGADDAKKKDERQKRAWTMAMRYGVEGLEAEERKELADLRATVTPEMRAAGTVSGSAGGYLVPQGYMPDLVKTMAMWGPMLDPGVTRVIDTDTGNNLPWPTVDDVANVGALLSENTQATEQDVTFGQRSLDAYTFTSKIVRVSLQLLQDSAFSMDPVLTELFGERIGRAANIYLTTGNGTSQPNGIVTASTLGKTAASATAVTADELMDLQHSVDPAYRSAPSCRWMFRDSTLLAIRKLKDGQGNYLWQMGDVRVGAPDTFLGHPYTINQAMPAMATAQRSVLFGDFNKYIVRRVRDFTVLRLVERYADFLQVGFIAFNRIDGEIADSSAIKHLVQA